MTRLSATAVAALLIAPHWLCAEPVPAGASHHGHAASRFFVDPPPHMDAPPASRFFVDPPPSLSLSAPARTLRSYRQLYRAARVEPSAYDALIREIAARHRVEYALVKAVIQAESDFDHRAVSPKGACGLMQLMPTTAASQGVRNVFVPRDNIEGGCRYLRTLLDRYDGDMTLALAAYNAGPDRVDAAAGVPAIDETREYLDRVLSFRRGYLRSN